MPNPRPSSSPTSKTKSKPVIQLLQTAPTTIASLHQSRRNKSNNAKGNHDDDAELDNDDHDGDPNQQSMTANSFLAASSSTTQVLKVQTLNSSSARFGTLKYRLLTERYAEEQEILHRLYEDVSTSSSSSSASSSSSSSLSETSSISSDDTDATSSSSNQQRRKPLSTRKNTKQIDQKDKHQHRHHRQEIQPATLHRARSIRILEEQTQNTATTALEALRGTSTTVTKPLSRKASAISLNSHQQSDHNHHHQMRNRKNRARTRRPHGIMSAQKYDDILAESGSDFDEMHLQHYAARSQTQINQKAVTLSSSYMVSQLPKRERRMREMHRACMWSSLIAATLFMRLLTGKQRRFAALIALKRWFRKVILIRRTKRKAGLRSAYYPPPHSDAALMLLDQQYRPTIEEMRDKYFPFLKRFDEMIPIHKPKEVLVEEVKKEREAARKRTMHHDENDNQSDAMTMLRESSSGKFTNSKHMRNLNQQHHHNNNSFDNLFPAEAALSLRLNPQIVEQTISALAQEKVDEDRRDFLKRQQQFLKKRDNDSSNNKTESAASARFKSLRRLLPLISTTNDKQGTQNSNNPFSSTTSPKSVSSPLFNFKRLRSASQAATIGHSTFATTETGASDDSSPTSPNTVNREAFLKREHAKLQFKEEEYAELEEAAASWTKIDFSSPKRYNQSLRIFSTTSNNLKRNSSVGNFNESFAEFPMLVSTLSNTDMTKTALSNGVEKSNSSPIQNSIPQPPQQSHQGDDDNKEQNEQQPSIPPLSIILAHILLKKMTLVTGNHLTNILQRQQQQQQQNQQVEGHPVAEWFLLSEGRVAEFERQQQHQHDDHSSYYYHSTSASYGAGGGGGGGLADLVFGDSNVELRVSKVHTKGACFGWLLPLPFPYPQAQLLLLGTTCKLWKLTHEQFHEALEEVFDFSETYNIRLHELTSSIMKKREDQHLNSATTATTTKRKQQTQQNNKSNRGATSPTTTMTNGRLHNSSSSPFQPQPDNSSMNQIYQQMAGLVNGNLINQNNNSNSSPIHHHEFIDANKFTWNRHEPKNFDPSSAFITDTLRIVKNVLQDVTKSSIHHQLQQDYALTPKLLRSVPMLRNVSDRALEGFCNKHHHQWSSAAMKAFMKKNNNDSNKDDDNDHNDDARSKDLIHWVGTISSEVEDESNSYNNNIQEEDPSHQQHKFLSLSPGFQLAAANDLNNAVYLPCGFGCVVTKRKIDTTKNAGGIASIKARATAPTIRSAKSGVGGRGAVIRFSATVPEVEENLIHFNTDHRGLVGADELILPRIADTSFFVGNFVNRTLPAALTSNNNNHFSLYSTFVRTFLFPSSFDFACWRFDKKIFQKLILHDPLEFLRQRDVVVQHLLHMSRMPPIPEAIIQIKVPLFRFAAASTIRDRVLPHCKPKFVFEGQLIPSSPLYADGIYIVVHGQVRRRRYGGSASTGASSLNINNNNNGINVLSFLRPIESDIAVGGGNDDQNLLLQQQQQQQQPQAPLGIQETNILLSEGRPLREIEEPIVVVAAAAGASSSSAFSSTVKERSRAGLGIQSFPCDHVPKHLEVTESLAPLPSQQQQQNISMIINANTGSSNDDTKNTKNQQHQNQHHRNNNNNNTINQPSSSSTYGSGGGAHALVYECEMRDPTTWVVLGGGWEGAMEHLPPPPLRAGQAELAPNEKWAAQWDSKWYCGGGTGGNSKNKSKSASSINQYTTRKPRSMMTGSSSPIIRRTSSPPASGRRSPPPMLHQTITTATSNNNKSQDELNTNSKQTLQQQQHHHSDEQEHTNSHNGCGYVLAYFIPSSALKDAFREMSLEVKKSTVDLAVAAREFASNLHPQVISRVVNPDFIPPAKQAQILQKTMSFLDKSVRPPIQQPQQHHEQTPLASLHPSPSPHHPNQSQAKIFGSIPLLPTASSPDVFFDDDNNNNNTNQTATNTTTTMMMSSPTTPAAGHLSSNKLKRLGSATAKHGSSISLLGGNQPQLRSMTSFLLNSNNNNTASAEPVLAGSYIAPQERKKTEKELFEEKIKALFIPLVLPPKSQVSDTAKKMLKKLDSWGIDGREDNDDGHRSALKSMLLKQQQTETQTQPHHSSDTATTSAGGHHHRHHRPSSPSSSAAQKTTGSSRAIVYCTEQKQQQQQQHPQSHQHNQRSSAQHQQQRSSSTVSPTRNHLSKRHSEQTFSYVLDEHGNVQKKSTVFMLPPPQIREFCAVVSSGNLEEEEEYEKEEREEEERQLKLQQEIDERERRKQILGYYMDDETADPQQRNNNKDQKEGGKRNGGKKKKQVGFATLGKNQQLHPNQQQQKLQQISRKYVTKRRRDQDGYESSSDDDLPFNSAKPDPDLEVKDLARHHRDETDLILHEQHLTVGEKLEVLLRESRKKVDLARARDGKHKKRPDDERAVVGVGPGVDQSSSSSSAIHNVVEQRQDYDFLPHERIVFKKVDRMIVSVVNGRVTTERKRSLPYQGPRQEHHHHHDQNQNQNQKLGEEPISSSRLSSISNKSSDFFHTFKAPEPPSSAHASRHLVSISRVNDTFSNTSQRQQERRAESARVISLNKMSMNDDENDDHTCEDTDNNKKDHSARGSNKTVLRFNGRIISSDQNNRQPEESKHQEQQQQSSSTLSKSKSILDAAMNFDVSNNNNQKPLSENNTLSNMNQNNNLLLRQQIAELSGETSLSKKKENELRYRRPVATTHATNQDWARFEHCLMHLKKKKNTKSKKDKTHQTPNTDDEAMKDEVSKADVASQKQQEENKKSRIDGMTTTTIPHPPPPTLVRRRVPSPTMNVTNRC